MPHKENRPTFAPLALFRGEEKLLSPQAQRRWLLALMIVGIALRLTRYLLRFPLWEDEAMLSANLIDRGYRELLLPLHYCQVAPTLFLWGAIDRRQTTRLQRICPAARFPFLCGLGSLLLFRHVAGRLLQGVSLVLAVGFFAVAYPMTRYAAEAKPYGCDLLWPWHCWPWRSNGCVGRTRPVALVAGGARRAGRGLFVSCGLHGRRGKHGDWAVMMVARRGSRRVRRD